MFQKIKTTVFFTVLLLSVTFCVSCRGADANGSDTPSSVFLESVSTVEETLTPSASSFPGDSSSSGMTGTDETTGGTDCEHDYVAVPHAPGCTIEGFTEYTCRICSDSYTGNKIPALGHDYEESIVPPSCLEGGYTEYVCKRCADTYRDHLVDALGHDYLETVVSPGCTEKGYTEYVCRRCSERYEDKETPALGHTFEVTREVSPTCVEEGYRILTCKACKITEQSDFVPALGHTYSSPVVTIASTCTRKGESVKTCTVCGATAKEELDYASHKYVKLPNIQPTSYKTGLTKGLACSVCGAVLTEQKTIPARGTNWILEDGCFKVLLIGNSFSQDASNCGQGMTDSKMLEILQAMLGPDVKIVVGLCQHGNRSMTWHATRVYRGLGDYTFHVISTDHPTWEFVGETDSKTALSYTNWDFVSLQPFFEESITGMGVPKFPDEEDPRFYPLSASSAYLLDWVNLYAPQADVYCYMHWSTTSDNVLNAALDKYNVKAKFFPTVLTYRGTDSGKVFADFVPVALSIQNARTTYFATLKYSNGTYTERLVTDAQSGLLRDGWHLTFNIGRYIAALTFAETLVPKELRLEDYTLPSMRRSEAIGDLPEAYTELAQKCVNAAMDSFYSAYDRLKVTAIKGFETDPAVFAASSLSSVKIGIRVAAAVDAVKNAIKNAVLDLLPADFAVTEVTLKEDVVLLRSTEIPCSVTIRFGYTSKTVSIPVHAEYTA